MKIWKVRLSLHMNDEDKWGSRFGVSSNDKEYELVSGRYWEVKKAWIMDDIPSKIEVKQVNGGYRVECGYEYLPNSKECEEIEKQMKVRLYDYIQNEFKVYEENHKLKIQGLFFKQDKL